MTQPTYNCHTVAIVRSSVTDRSTKEAEFIGPATAGVAGASPTPMLVCMLCFIAVSL